MLFAGSSEGAQRACVLLGIVATCRAIEVSGQAYLVWALEQLGTHRGVFGLNVADIVPAAFKPYVPRTRGRGGPPTRLSRSELGRIPVSLIGHFA